MLEQFMTTRLGSGVTLFLGGARSGKSDLVVRVAEQWSAGVTFVATAQPTDEDMQRRILAHQQDRPPNWSLLERPLFAAGDVATIDADHLVVVDCATVLVSNLLYRADNAGSSVDLTSGHTGDSVRSSGYVQSDHVQSDHVQSDHVQSELAVLDHCDALMGALAKRDTPSLLVSSEVGLGVHPPSQLGNRYRDVLGKVNQRCASAAGAVLFVIAGRVLPLRDISIAVPSGGSGVEI